MVGKRRLGVHGPQQRMLRSVIVHLCLVLSVTQPILAFTQYSGFRQRQQLRPQSWDEDGMLRMKPVCKASAPPHSNLAVSLDQPLMSPVTGTAKSVKKVVPSGNFLNTSPLVKVLVSDAFKAALIAFVLAVGLSLLSRTSALESFQSKVSTAFKLVKGRLLRFMERFQREERGVAMAFDPNVSDGWERCTLRSKRSLGKTSFAQYDFDLPQARNILGLPLGQKVYLCCVDNQNRLAKGEFFPHKTGKSGSFSILAPNRSMEENQVEVGRDASNFARVLREDMKVGDEVALKPGEKRLSYRGEYLPVTDMLYFVDGLGVVPVLEQVRTVLKSKSSTVKSLEVVWVNQDTKDFDVIAAELEDEYYKHSDKLSVQCIVDDLRTRELEDSDEIETVIPDFRDGIMAVVAGPPDISKKARDYLIRRGYPEGCVCVL